MFLLGFFMFCMPSASYLSHVYIVQYGIYFLHVSQLSLKRSPQNEKLGKYGHIVLKTMC